MQIELLSGGPPKQQRRTDVYAVHGMNAAHELGMLAALRDMAGLAAPLLQALLQGPVARPAEQLVTVTETAVQEACARFGLNDDQAAAVRQIAPWLDNSAVSEVSKMCAAMASVCKDHKPVREADRGEQGPWRPCSTSLTNAPCICIRAAAMNRK